MKVCFDIRLNDDGPRPVIWFKATGHMYGEEVGGLTGCYVPDGLFFPELTTWAIGEEYLPLAYDFEDIANFGGFDVLGGAESILTFHRVWVKPRYQGYKIGWKLGSAAMKMFKQNALVMTRSEDLGRYLHNFGLQLHGDDLWLHNPTWEWPEHSYMAGKITPVDPPKPPEILPEEKRKVGWGLAATLLFTAIVILIYAIA